MFGIYVEHGWKICAIEPGNKGPSYAKWQKNPIPLEAADAIEGAGIIHTLSGTCAIDIDNMLLAKPFLAERGVDIDALLRDQKAVRIHSGRTNRAKLLYRLRKPLRTIKPKNSGIEFRCEGAQDVLPPTVHPDTKRPYEWRYGEPMLGDWRELPPVPANLLGVWRELLTEHPPEEAPPEHTPGGHGLPELEHWIRGQDPNMDYDDWVKVGMKLHHATAGSQEGFDLWNNWSKTATRKQRTGPKVGSPVYEGAGKLKIHWVSFVSSKGKVVATVEHELPAEADEFETITPEAAAAPSKTQEAAKVDGEKAAEKRKEALAILTERLVYVISAERYFDLKHHRIINSDNAIEHMFTSRMPRRKGVRINPVKLLKDVGAKQVDKLGFHPGRGAIFKADGSTFANNYINRLPEPIPPKPDEVEKIEWLFGRIDDPEYRQWLKQFYAHAVQRPGVKIKSIPLIWSEIQRNGKSTLVKAIPQLLVGAAYSADVSTALLNSDFNDYLLDAWHVNLSEFRAGTRTDRTANVAKLRAWITDDVIPMHPKGGRGYSFPNHFFMTASSNEDDAVPVDGLDERWGIHTLDVPKFTHEERKWIYHDYLLTDRAAPTLRHYFMNYTLAGFDASGSAPTTLAKREMVEASMPRDAELLYTLWEEKAEFFNREVVLVSEVVQFIHKNTPVRPSAKRVGKLLARPPIGGKAKVFRQGDKTYRAIILKNYSRWATATGAELIAHISGGEESIDMLE
jgi:hypothetical protein